MAAWQKKGPSMTFILFNLSLFMCNLSEQKYLPLNDDYNLCEYVDLIF